MVDTKARSTEFFEKFWQPSPSGLPKYAQLRDILVAAIDAGHWKAGEKLPTESELTELTPFSLGTVQRALRALVDEGLVNRIQGSGTFVAQDRTPFDTPLHCRFLRDGDERDVLPVYPKAISRQRIAERGPWSDYLTQEGRNIMRVDRRLSIDGEFDVYSRFYFNADRFGGIDQTRLSQLDRMNLKQMLSSEFNLPITHVTQRVMMHKFPADICRAIHVKPGTVGMLLESIGSAGRKNPIYYLETFIPPTKRKLVVSEL